MSQFFNEAMDKSTICSSLVLSTQSSALSGYCAVYPPSITNSDPVTNDDSSDAR